MLLFWRKNRIIDAFSIELADEFYSQLPPDLAHAAGGRADPKAARKFDKELQRAGGRLREFIHVHDLGVYGKARVQLKVMQRLQELGYPEELIGRVKEYLLLNVS